MRRPYSGGVRLVRAARTAPCEPVAREWGVPCAVGGGLRGEREVAIEREECPPYGVGHVGAHSPCPRRWWHRLVVTSDKCHGWYDALGEGLRERSFWPIEDGTDARAR